MDSIQKFKTDEKGMAEFTEMVLHALNLGPDDELEAVYKNNAILINKSGKFCFICGSEENLEELGNNKFACHKCLSALNKAIKH